MSALRVVYRAAPGGNRKRRPPFFSKWLSLVSMLQAAEIAGATMTFCCDGELPAAVAGVLAERGEVVQLGGLGNSRSYVATLRVIRRAGFGDDEWVYLCEDDYLHLPDALLTLRQASLQSPRGSYLALYDHPDRYSRQDDWRTNTEPLIVDGQRWVGVESINMTYAAQVGVLDEDRFIHRAFSVGRYPRDRSLWRTLQALGPFGLTPLAFRRRTLRASVPGWATHCEENVLAAGHDWSAVSNDALAWAASVGLPAVEGW